MNYRNFLIKLFTFLGGIYFFLEFVLPKNIFGFEFGKYNDQISEGFVAIGALTFGLGLFNLLAVHGGKIIFLRKGWFNSLGLMLGLAFSLFAASADWLVELDVSKKSAEIFMLRDFSARIIEDADADAKTELSFGQRIGKLSEAVDKTLRRHMESLAALDYSSLPVEDPNTELFRNLRNDTIKEFEQAAVAAQSLGREKASGEKAKVDIQTLGEALSTVANKEAEALRVHSKFTLTKGLYSFMYDGLFVGLSSAMFSILGFYIAGAAYRAFRIRSIESALMMGAALVVMLGQIPFGVWIWSGFPELRLWILKIPNAAAFRAIAFGASIAGLIMAFRMWLSIEADDVRTSGGGQA